MGAKQLNGYNPGDAPVEVRIGHLQINGFLSSLGVASFYGIPFATIPGRFRDAHLLNPEQTSGVIDATKYGCKCPQPPDPPRVERDHLYAGANITPSPDSEFSCLKLSIYGPPEALLPGHTKLPVLVWIHGGGWVIGDGHGDYTGEFLVQHAMDKGRPFIFVAINYRVNYFGFLSSQELREEAKTLGENGWASQGLQDQRLALLWVKNYIGHFGGDGEQVTISGESAGAWSVLAHLHGHVPVCQYAIIHSAPSLNPASAVEAQAAFDDLVARAGIPANAPAPEKLAALRTLPAKQLAEMVQSGSLQPPGDAAWFGKDELDLSQPLERLGGHLPAWIKGVVVGSTLDEMALFGLQRRLPTKEAIDEAVALAYGDTELLAPLKSVYGFDTASDYNAAYAALIQLTSDALFGRAPYAVVSAAKASGKPVCVYRFDQQDIEPTSPFRGWAFHALDNAYICRMPAVAGTGAPDACRATADAISKMFMDLVYGRMPWEPYTEAGRLMIFNGGQTGMATTQRKWEAIITSEERYHCFTRGTERFLM